MLTALLISMLFGGGSTAVLGYIADAEDRVKIVMVKDERRREALGTLKAMKKRTNARSKLVRRSAKSLNKALNQDNIAAADIDAIWDGYFAGIDQYDHDMLDLRYQLKGHINREEWQEIFPGPE